MKKKKLILIVAGSLVALVLVAMVLVVMSLDRIVKTGVETVGPKLTKTTVTLDGVSIQPVLGSGEITGLEVGNPAGYQGEFAIKLGRAHLDLSPGSLLKDKVVIESMVVEGAEIILEGGLKDNNLTAIQKNVASFSGPADEAPAPAGEPAESAAAKKLQVDHFKIEGVKVHLRLTMLAGQNLTITAPPVEMTGLGTGPDGITAADLVKRAMKQLTDDVLVAAGKAVTEAATQAGNQAIDEAGKSATEAVGKASEGLKNLFNKKE